jgi:trimeric autotransporter adhesin
MTIATTPLGTSYLDPNQLPKLLRAFEGFVGSPYDDGKHIPSIGIGINLRVSTNVQLMLDALGVFKADDETPAGQARSDFQRRLRYDQIIIDFITTIALNPVTERGDPPGSSSSEVALLNALNAKLQTYGVDHPFTVGLEEAKTIKARFIGGFGAGAYSGSDSQFGVKGAQQKLDLVLQGLDIGRDTREYEALMSLRFNLESLVSRGNKVYAALAAGDRAEAWFQIRYGSNADWQNAQDDLIKGLAARRGAEAQLFGLYDETPTLQNALGAYRMLQLNRTTISAYEALHSADITNANTNQEEAVEVTGHIPTLIEALIPAEQLLIADLNARYGLNLSPANFDPTRIFLDPGRRASTSGETHAQVAVPIDLEFSNRGIDSRTYTTPAQTTEIPFADILIGEGGSDHLISGAGDDVLIGGTADDELEGGAGFDTYVFSTGDGVDKIKGNDNDGKIVFNGITVTGTAARSVPLQAYDHAWYWQSGDEVFYFGLKRGGPSGDTLQVLHGNGPFFTDAVTIENFTQGDLGITLADDPSSVFLPEGTITNPFADPNFVPITQSTTLIEGHSRTVTLAFNASFSTDRLVQIEVNLLAPKLLVVTGAETLAFQNGTLNLLIPAGQDTLTFALLSQGDVDIDQSVNLTATLLDAGGAPSSVTAALTIEFDARDEAAPTEIILDNVFDMLTSTSNGTPDEDLFVGTAGEDEIFSRSGGDDILEGRGGDDWLIDGLGGGNDHIIGGTGRDVGDIGEGADLFEGGAEADVAYGGTGDDQLFADEQVSVDAAITAGALAESINEQGENLQGAEGDDLLVGSTRNDHLGGGSGQDILIGGGGNDFLTGDEWYNFGHDISPIDFDFHTYFEWTYVREITTNPDGSITYSFTVTGAGALRILEESAADVIYAGTGNDDVLAGGGDDFISGDDGDDIVLAQDGNDTILGGAGNDVLDGGDETDTTGRDFLDGGDGADSLQGAGGGDTLFGGDGNDTLAGDDLNASDGDDYLNGEMGDDILFGGGGADRLEGGSGNDVLLGDQSDTTERQGADVLDGGTGADELRGYGGNDILVGGSGTDQLFGDSPNTPDSAHGDDALDGGEDDDLLVGGGGADQLLGGEGGDQLWGDANTSGLSASRMGRDTLDGGAGADQLVGGGAADQLSGGDGDDVIHGDDVVDRVAGIAHGADEINAGAGNDNVVGWGGNDTISGGEGNDTLLGDQDVAQLASEFHGNDLIDGGAGNDAIAGHGGDDALYGGVGDDVLQGGEGDDLLIGGAGADYLEGGAGADVYIFDTEDLRVVNGVADTLFDLQGHNHIVLRGLSQSDVQVFAGLTTGSLTLSYATETEDFALVIEGALSGAINSFEFADGEVVSASELIGRHFVGVAEQNTAADGATVYGGALNDALTATGSNAELSGGRGNDVLTGGTGSTTYYYGLGDGLDTLIDSSTWVTSSGQNRNVVEFGEGIGFSDLRLSLAANASVLTLEVAGAGGLSLSSFSLTDLATGTRTLDELHFSDGTVKTWADLVSVRGVRLSNPTDAASYVGTNVSDEILGSPASETVDAGAGDDWIDGGAGDDTLSGGAGSDTYFFSRGSGRDTLNNTDTASGKIDCLIFAADIAPQHVTFYRSGNDLVAQITGTADEVYVPGYFSSAGLDEIRFNDGTMYTPANVPFQAPPSPTSGDDNLFGFGGNDLIDALAGNDALRGGAGNDTLRGNDGDDALQGETGNDVLEGGAGNDTLAGGQGNDTLEGGAGVDTLDGGAGNDTYIFALGTGSDTITQSDTALGKLDTLHFGAGIRPQDVVWSVGFNGDLIVRIRQASGAVGSDQITISGFFSDVTGASRIERFTFSDEPDFVWFADEVSYRAQLPTNANDVIFGSTSADALSGDGGADTIRGGSGSDTLSGGAGADSLYGEDGTDWLDGGAGDDLLEGGAGDDTLVAGVGRDILRGGEGRDTYLIEGAGGEVTIDEAALSGSSTILFGAGILPAHLIARPADSGQIELQVLDPATGLVRHRVTFIASAIELIRFQDDSNTVFTATQIPLLLQRGSAEDDVLLPAVLDDVMTGLEGDDVLSGGDGDDDLDGGLGNDQLSGGLDSDTYHFDRNQGSDEIMEGGGSDAIVLAAGITTSQVTLYRSSGAGMLSEGPITADDLILVIDGGASQLRVENYFDTAGGFGIEEIRFANGTVWNTSDIAARLVDASGTANTFNGTSANNTYTVDHRFDEINEAVGQGTDTVNSSVSYTLPGNVENLVLTGPLNFSGTGNALNNRIDGNSAANVLNGGTGTDTLVGGAGDDTYLVDGVEDLVQESSNEGTDTLIATQAFNMTLAANVERFEGRWDSAGQVIITGNALDNVLDAPGSTSGPAVTLDGGAGADTLIGRGAGNHIYVVDNSDDVVIDTYKSLDESVPLEPGLGDEIRSSVSYQIAENVERLTLTGGAAVTATGNTAANILDGSQNTAANTLIGGAGDDLYLVGANDSVTESAGGGSDRLRILSGATQTYSTAAYANIEQIELSDALGASSLLGDSSANILIGNSLANTLEGGVGNDVITDTAVAVFANADNDTLSGGDGNDTLISTNGNDELDGGTGDDVLHAAAFGETTLWMGSGSGHDTLVHGLFDFNVGFDVLRLHSGILPTDVELIRSGTDLLVRIAGTSDQLTIQNEWDGAGTPWAITQIRFANGTIWNANDITSRVIVAPLTGTANVDRLFGGAGDDTLLGSAGSDTLTGGLGNDLLRGGAGADTYRFSLRPENAPFEGFGVDVIQDTDGGTPDTATDVIEFDASIRRADVSFAASVTNLNDLVISIRGYADRITVKNFFAAGTAADRIEEFRFTDGTTLTASDIVASPRILGTEGADTLNAPNASTSLFGHGGNDVLNGGTGDDLLDGGLGADSMSGGAGSDRYIVDDAEDTVTEAMGGGIDRVDASINAYVMPDHVENLQLTGPIARDALGNALDNEITGTENDNVLNGGAGADTLTGLSGNDTYIVDSVGDVIIEADSAGVDLVRSSASYSLAANVENLTLEGTAALSATGNELANRLEGNAAANVLDGGTGDDTLVGGAGNDVYFVDSTEDEVIEIAGQGTDEIRSTASIILPAEVEVLTLLGTANLDATGNALANEMNGNAGDNALDGGAGVDTMRGGAGNDTYTVDHANDTVMEGANEGLDSVLSAVSYTLASHVENLTLIGTAAINATGNADANMLTGNGAANILDGGLGADTLEGGGGNDIYVVDSVSDVVQENSSEGSDLVRSYITYTLGAHVEQLTLLGTSAIDAFGNSSANILTGNAAGNLLDGGAGIDQLVGGMGDDIYVLDTASDQITEAIGEGFDTVRAGFNYALGATLEALELTGAGNFTATGNAFDNVLSGNSGNNTLTGMGGADTMQGGAGNDTYVVENVGDVVIEQAGEGTDLVQSSVSFTLAHDVENLTLTGSSAINATGNDGSNMLTGNSGANTLDGGAGADILQGGGGNDIYLIDDAGDQVLEGASAGTDEVRSGVSFALSANLENLVLIGSQGLTGTGNTLVNRITGNSGNNTLDGGAGVDTLIGGLGDDTYIADSTGEIITELAGEGNDIVQSTASYALGAQLESLVLLGTGNLTATGNELANTLFGNSGNNTLNGLAGADSMQGGAGNDTYVVDDTGDTVIENANEGVDLVQSGVSYTLSAQAENLTLTGSAALTGSGNDLDNLITGNSGANTLNGGNGNDTLDGGTGNDMMFGGAGDDTYFVNATGDQVSELANAGIDTVQSSVTYTLSAEVENLILTGTSGNTANGNLLDNALTGNSGANTLNGMAGADIMSGAGGNDTYMVDNVGDSVIELANQGTDTIQSSVTFTLGAHVENLTLINAASINAIGNALDNVLTGNTAANTLTGNDGNDTLNGGTGADSLFGGLGNDTYVIDNVGDSVSENVNEGADLVQSSITYTLTDNVENLTLTGSSGLTGNGNALDNILIGNTGANTLNGGAGNDRLDGGSGNDTMAGGQGDDVYVVAQASDATNELAGEGIDRVESSITRTLSDHIEVLFLTGSSTLTGSGNALANLLRGNTGANSLVGNGGNDILEGGGGADTLTGSSINSFLNGGAANDTLNGGAANDLFVGGVGNDILNAGAGADIIAFNRGDGLDTVNASTTQDNTLSLGNGIRYADLLFQKTGNDLVLITGTSEQLTFKDYFLSASNRHIDQLQIIIEGTADYDAGSSDATRNKKIESFDFEGLVSAFDAALVANPSLTSWALTNALGAQHLGGSDTAAIGGDLAYRYGRYNTLSDISFNPALGILGSASFGSSAQSLQALAVLQDSSVRLS